MSYEIVADVIRERDELKSRLDECRESCARAVAARDVATARLDRAAAIIRYALDSHEGEINYGAAQAWLTEHDRVVERLDIDFRDPGIVDAADEFYNKPV